ncbi:MAG: hypothetical protein ACFFCI_02250 [Promethearchaeota archaeon]
MPQKELLQCVKEEEVLLIPKTKGSPTPKDKKRKQKLIYSYLLQPHP